MSVSGSEPQKALWNRTQNRLLADPLFVPHGFWMRGLGLLIRPPLRNGEGLWLSPSGGIHTWGMRYPIAVLFVNADGKVLRVLPHVPPCRVAFAPHGTRSVAELLVSAPLPKVGDLVEVR